jgi:hypothetical protein
MSAEFHLYVKAEQKPVLESAEHKTFLLGGDFGYGNFGDILQCCNTIAFHRSVSQSKIVAVLAVEAITDEDFVHRASNRYDVDAVIYISRTPWQFNELCPVNTIRNAGLVHFYGGGLINVLWGPYVLKVASYLLERLRPTGYVISGQQVSAPLQFALIDHCRVFQPLLVGVRDSSSQALMEKAGLEASFTFDDASESLLSLARRLPLLCDRGLLTHLNLSVYTRNLSSDPTLRAELKKLAAAPEARDGLTVVQAFASRQFDVCDSFESIKQLATDFPFHDYRLLDLVRLIDSGCDILSTPIKAAIGYSCSYHVALWLQLAGIPCWLRSGSSFYSQKQDALQVSQSLGQFLASPHLADHRESLERRQGWLENLERTLHDLPLASGLSEPAVPQPGNAPAWTYRGKATRMARMAELVDAQRAELGDFSERVVALSRSTTRLGSELHERNHAFWLLEQERDRFGRELHERNHAIWLVEQERDRLGRELHERNHAFWLLDQLRERLQQDNETLTRRLHGTLPERCKWFLRRQMDRLRRKLFPAP